MVETRRLRELTRSAIARLDLPADGPLVIALSGGADSAALAYLCIAAGRELRALHVNHGLRGSAVMESAARAISDQLGVSLEVRVVSVPSGASPEGQARVARYAEFAEALRSGELLVTGHTIDDNAETILLNLVRGTGSRGVAGIPYGRSPGILRPALDISRGEAREIATLAGLHYADDPMNTDLSLARNWVRSVIIPQLRELNPRLAESLRRAGRNIAVDSDYLDALAEASGPKLGEDGSSHPRGALMSAPRPVADRVVMRMLEHVIGEQGVTADRIEKVWSVAHGRSSRQELGDGAIAELIGPLLVIASGPVSTSDEEARLEPGSHDFGSLRIEVRSVPRPCRVMPLSAWAAVFPAGTELVIRPDGVVTADGEAAWVPGRKRMPVAWYEPGTVGYLSVTAREGTGWTSSRS